MVLNKYVSVWLTYAELVSASFDACTKYYWSRFFASLRMTDKVSSSYWGFSRSIFVFINFFCWIKTQQYSSFWAERWRICVDNIYKLYVQKIPKRVRNDQQACHPKFILSDFARPSFWGLKDRRICFSICNAKTPAIRL